jgi:CheY-like chemotaxis protein
MATHRQEDLEVNRNCDLGGRPLVVLEDDDVVPRLIARLSLERAGFDVAEASDGREGLAAFERLRPALGRSHADPLMSGLDDVESIRRAFEVGATDFATNPI